MAIEYVTPPEQHWKKFLTEEEYWGLSYAGRMLADYWTEFLPKMCAKMKEQGTLRKTLEEEGDNLCELEEDLIADGYPLDAAREVMKESLYQLPPEK